MTDAVVHPTNPFSGAALRVSRLATRLGRSLGRIVLARATRRALNELPDDLLADIGLARSDIPFVVSAIACGYADRRAMRRTGSTGAPRARCAARRVGLRACVAPSPRSSPSASRFSPVALRRMRRSSAANIL